MQKANYSLTISLDKVFKIIDDKLASSSVYVGEDLSFDFFKLECVDKNLPEDEGRFNVVYKVEGLEGEDLYIGVDGDYSSWNDPSYDKCYLLEKQPYHTINVWQRIGNAPLTKEGIIAKILSYYQVEPYGSTPMENLGGCYTAEVENHQGADDDWFIVLEVQDKDLGTFFVKVEGNYSSWDSEPNYHSAFEVQKVTRTVEAWDRV
jgi:hypothetical protein